MDIDTSVATSSGSWHLSDMTSSLIRRMSGTVSMLQPWGGCIPTNSLLFRTEDDTMVDDNPTHHAGSTMMPVPAINQLPVEILTEIFSCYLMGGDEVNMLPNAPSCLSFSSKSQSNPMALESVCEHWRDILLSSPSLWSSMCIFAPSFDHLKRISRWLQHAGGCPLSLELRQSDEPNNLECLATDEIVELLFNCFYQWKSIDFRIDRFATAPALSKVPSSPPPWLEHASLYVSSTSYSNWLDKMWSIIHASPVLRSINWWSFQDSASSIFALDRPSFPGNIQAQYQINPRIPSSQLIDLKLSSLVTVSGALALLRSCQNLERFHISLVDSSSEVIPAETLVASYTLRDLYVSAVCDAASLFDHIILPSLEILHIGQTYAERLSPIGPSFHRFIVRSNCPLQKFRFLDYKSTEDEVLELLTAPLPSLVELVLVCKLGEAVISSLTCMVVDGNVRCLLPRLENFEILEAKISDEIVARMLLSRIYYHYHEAAHISKSISFLKSVKISGFLFTLYNSPILQPAGKDVAVWKDFDGLVQAVANLYQETRRKERLNVYV